ncbi:MAG: glycoside hydrolase family 65 protein, partial [Saprospiraceae bacterium]|nr:glycoside hydrolase family 65 protein [Saprospiraceae bacterium]
RLNIGPKGFTGEKYGGSTYWDTEAYCLPFYMSTANQSIGRNLLVYRHRHLPQAIDNARKLGFSAGAALYPMVTMNGEECHNEWEITFEEIHRNGAIAFAIFDYVRYTDDHSYLVDYGAEVLIGIARFWSQRVHWSQPKERYVIHGVTGPNEYENNINNNWHTNYIARWCLNYAAEILQPNVPEALQPVIEKTRVTKEEVNHWISIAGKLYLPSDPETGLIMQQEGFLDKDIRPAKEIAKTEIPINQHWSWDRILRSCYIKQADVLQGLYFFEDDFTRDTIEKNFMFYEPLTVHESSLSPCVHSILASVIGQHESAYQMYLRTARLDLDDYNNDTEDGCHITSMAGTWMAIVKGFAGMRIRDNRLSFRPHCPAQWQSFRFQITWRKNLLTVQVDDQKLEIENRGPDLTFYLVDDLISLSENQKAKYDI